MIPGVARCSMASDQTTLLCVDDEPGILAALKRVLADDFTVVTAPDVEAGIQILEERPEVALVLSDHRMPGINGFDFLAWCQAHRPGIIRVALTGYPEAQLMRDAQGSGLVALVIAKPWDDGELVRTLQSLVAAERSTA